MPILDVSAKAPRREGRMLIQGLRLSIAASIILLSAIPAVAAPLSPGDAASRIGQTATCLRRGSVNQVRRPRPLATNISRLRKTLP